MTGVKEFLIENWHHCQRAKDRMRVYQPRKYDVMKSLSTILTCVLFIQIMLPGKLDEILLELLVPDTTNYSAVRAPYPPYSGGVLYDQQYGRIYIPNEVTENTAFTVFFCGGCGEDCLPYGSILKYYKYYSPDAVMLWVNRSYWTDPQKAAVIAYGVFNSVAEDAGVTFGPESTLCTGGASAGGYTAIASAEYFWSSFGIPVKSIAVFDMSNEWRDSGSALMDENQCKELAASGTHIYALEQNHIAGGGGPIYTMQDWQKNYYLSMIINSGIDFTFINCKEGGHADILKNGLRFDVYGHMLRDTMYELPANHYILISPQEFADGAKQSDYVFSSNTSKSDEYTEKWDQ